VKAKDFERHSPSTGWPFSSICASEGGLRNTMSCRYRHAIRSCSWRPLVLIVLAPPKIGAHARDYNGAPFHRMNRSPTPPDSPTTANPDCRASPSAWATRPVLAARSGALDHHALGERGWPGHRPLGTACHRLRASRSIRPRANTRAARSPSCCTSRGLCVGPSRRRLRTRHRADPSENRWTSDPSPLQFKQEHLRSLVPAGRLDIDSTGLLVLTQDGRIAKQLIGETPRSRRNTWCASKAPHPRRHEALHTA
jgi:hypothetical protein